MNNEFKGYGISSQTAAAINAADAAADMGKKIGVSALVALVEENRPALGRVAHGDAKKLSDAIRAAAADISAAKAKYYAEKTIGVLKYAAETAPYGTQDGLTLLLAKISAECTSISAAMALCGGKDAAAEKAKAKKDAAADTIRAEKDAADAAAAAFMGAYAGGILAAPIAAWCAWGEAEILPARRAAAADAAAARAAADAARAAAAADAARAARIAAAADAADAADAARAVADAAATLKGAGGAGVRRMAEDAAAAAAAYAALAARAVDDAAAAATLKAWSEGDDIAAAAAARRAADAADAARAGYHAIAAAIAT